MNDMNYNMLPGEGEQKGQGFRFWFLIGAAIILCVAVGIGAAVLINNNTKQQKYISVVNMANGYYSAGDYQNALVCYEQAIEMNAQDPSNYLNMSSIYSYLGEYESAQDIILRGLDYCVTSELLQKRLSELQNRMAEEPVKELSTDEIKQLAENITTENAVFDMVAAYTYTEYYRDFGTPTSSTANNGQVTLWYAAMDFNAVYYDMDNERVLNDTKSMPLASVKPCYVSFQNIRSLFSGSEETFAVSFDKLKELFGNETAAVYDETQNKYYVTAKYKGCKLTIETDENGNVVSEGAWNQLEPSSRKGLDLSDEAEGEVSGYIQDAMNGKGMVAAIKVRNRGSRNGQVLAEFSSSADGSYTFAGAHGQYTLEISANGYTTEYIDVEIIRGQVKTGKNVVLSPVVEEGEIRIVLSWGSLPSDLDSHAEGRSSTGSNFHISYQNKFVNNVGTLDVDDRNGFGPETITITDSNASFTYSVVDFTESSAMSSSGAVVKVYLPGNTQAITYNVPSGTGNTWEVFRYENGQITQINSLY